MKKSNHSNYPQQKKQFKTKIKRIGLLLSLFALVIIWSIFTISQALSNTLQDRQLLVERQRELAYQEIRRQVLESDLQKLDDPEYIAQYARETYLYTSEDELLFILPKEEFNEGTTTNA